MSKINASEKQISDYSSKLKKGGNIDISDMKSSELFDIIKELSNNVEMLNIEIRSNNQSKINILTKKVNVYKI